MVLTPSVVLLLNLLKMLLQLKLLVLKLLKRSMLQGADMPLGSALAFEHAMIGLVFDTADSKEGCGAFLEKRAPDFQGR